MTDKPDTRELLQRRLETQLREWSTRIDHLKAEAERDMAEAELREQLYERLQKVRDLQRLATEKLTELRHSGAKAWRSAKKDIDRLRADIEDAFDGLTAKRTDRPVLGARAARPAKPRRRLAAARPRSES